MDYRLYEYDVQPFSFYFDKEQEEFVNDRSAGDVSPVTDIYVSSNGPPCLTEEFGSLF